MSTRVRTKAGPRLMNHLDLAAVIGMTPKTLRRRVVAGEWPEPHSIVGRHWLYEVGRVEHYLREGAWPEGTRFKAGVGRGRGMQ